MGRGRAFTDADGVLHFSAYTTTLERERLKRKYERAVERKKRRAQKKQMLEVARAGRASSTNRTTRLLFNVNRYCRKLTRRCCTEHTLCSLFKPPKDDEALTASQERNKQFEVDASLCCVCSMPLSHIIMLCSPSQMVQLFFNALMLYEQPVTNCTGQAAAAEESDMSPAQESDMSPAEESDMSLAGERDMSRVGERDMASVGERHTAAVGESDIDLVELTCSPPQSPPESSSAANPTGAGDTHSSAVTECPRLPPRRRVRQWASTLPLGHERHKGQTDSAFHNIQPMSSDEQTKRKLLKSLKCKLKQGKKSSGPGNVSEKALSGRAGSTPGTSKSPQSRGGFLKRALDARVSRSPHKLPGATLPDYDASKPESPERVLSSPSKLRERNFASRVDM
ncbi:MAG: hypothetical protein SGPRY_010480, partial [Prymnesium sp.]